MAGNAAFRRRLKDALESRTLPVALNRVLPRLRERRDVAFADRDFASQRAVLGDRRREAVDRLPELLIQFTEAAQAASANVYPPTDATGAVRTVLDILQRHQVRLVVKSKSMATEEIALNPALEAAGVEVVETDLGEFLVQQAGEHPSHIIAPALHITRERAAELIGTAVGKDLPPDPDRLVGEVRQFLRAKFIAAGAGITGANALIAETGAIMLVSNEGNARLASALPPVHIVIAGIDKLTPTMADAAATLELLPRSATGQPISTYVSFITGPSRSADIELSLSLGVHGPREVHIVLLDNGRTAMRDDPEFRAALQCVRCGACSNICPPYAHVGGHAMGYVYSGPIGLILTPFHHGPAEAAGPQTLCAGCNACATVCPADIPLPTLILKVREQSVAQGHSRSWIKRVAFAVLARPKLFAFAARTFARIPGLQAISHVLPGSPLKRRPLPPVARTPFRDRIAANQPDAAGGPRVAYFPGCLTDWTAPELGDAALAVVQRTGVQVIPHAFASCCGLPAINAGYKQPAIDMAKQTIQDLESLDIDWVVSSSTSCAGAMLQDYPRLLRDEPEWVERARRATAKVVDLARFLQPHAPWPSLAPSPHPRGEGWGEGQPESTRRVVTIHDACQSKHGFGIGPEIRDLLSSAGYEVREALPSGECCGFGGSFSFDHPEVARRMRRRKLDAFAATGAEFVCTDNPGCLLHLRCGERIAGAPEPMHLAELLARADAEPRPLPK